MKKMNDMSMKELIETEKRINWRLHEDCHYPPLSETEQAIDNNYEFQESMGAWEIDHDCPVCGRRVTTGKAFCSDECKQQKVNGWKLRQVEIKREETMRFLRGKND